MLTLLLVLQAQNPLAHTVDPIRTHQNILHYEFLVEIPDTGNEISVLAGIRYEVSQPNRALVLDLDDAMRVAEVLDESGPVPFRHEGDSLVIEHWGDVGETFTVGVRYEGAPTDGLFIQESARGRRSVFADNWPNRAHFWIPVEDHPSDKATVSWAVRVPAAWKVVANGRLADTSRTDDGHMLWSYEERRAIPAYTFVIGAGEMAVTPLVTEGGVRQSLWTTAEDSAFAVDQPFQRVNEIVDVFSEYIGLFPYDKLAHVQSSSRFGGMENSGAIFYAGRGYTSRRMTEGLVVHETAHQWFGDAVTQYDWHHLWLSEGFATYFTSLFHDLIGEAEPFRAGMERGKRRYVGSDVVDRPILDFAVTDYMQLLNSNNYPKGGWVLHMLRRTIGDDAFRSGIREFYATFRDSTALSQDFRAVMERVSGEELGWFFAQWLSQPGYPQLRVEVRRVGKPADGRTEAAVFVEQIQPEVWGTFRIPVRIDVVNDEGERATVAVEMTSRTAQAMVELPAGANRIVVDPEGDVLLTAEAVWGGGG